MPGMTFTIEPILSGNLFSHLKKVSIVVVTALWASTPLHLAISGHCIIGKYTRLFFTQCFHIICNIVALFTFYAIPSNSKLKGPLRDGTSHTEV